VKRLIGTVLGLGVLMVLPLGAAAAGSFDQATGSGERPAAGGFGPRSVAFSAHNGPNGPSGHIRFHGGGPAPEFNDSSSHVTCLLVDGNRAVIGGVMDRAAIEERVGWTVMFAVEDNGNPSGAIPDRLSVSLVDPAEVLDPEDCTAGTALYTTLVPITSGNFEVDDAP
jgi:hypothetical protein